MEELINGLADVMTLEPLRETDCEIHSYCPQTNQVFLIVAGRWDNETRFFVEAYLRGRRPGLLVGRVLI